MESKDMMSKFRELADEFELKKVDKLVRKSREFATNLSLNTASKSEIVRKMGYNNMKDFLNQNPLEAVTKVSKKKLIEMYKEGHTSESSFNSLMQEVKELEKEMEEQKEG